MSTKHNNDVKNDVLLGLKRLGAFYIERKQMCCLESQQPTKQVILV